MRRSDSDEEEDQEGACYCCDQSGPDLRRHDDGEWWCRDCDEGGNAGNALTRAALRVQSAGVAQRTCGMSYVADKARVVPTGYHPLMSPGW